MVEKKPPLGLAPRNIAFDAWKAQRRGQIADAILRYVSDGQTPIPVEWIEEYNELISDGRLQ